MAIAMTCWKCGGRVYLGSPDPENWDYVPRELTSAGPCPHPQLVSDNDVESSYGSP